MYKNSLTQDSPLKEKNIFESPPKKKINHSENETERILLKKNLFE